MAEETIQLKQLKWIYVLFCILNKQLITFTLIISWAHTVSTCKQDKNNEYTIIYWKAIERLKQLKKIYVLVFFSLKQ